MLFALLTGFVLLMIYGKFRRFSWRELMQMALSGILAVKNIAIVMLLVGALTALWRACGTVAFIVNVSSGALSPGLFLPASFALCAVISVLTGTSIGTAATMGVICMSVGNSMPLSGWFSAACGGAILAGSFFGDRCSPVSTSAMLVAEITETKLYENIRRMIRTGWTATAVALVIYGVLGFFAETDGSETASIGGDSAINTADGIARLLQSHYDLSWPTLLPAIAIVVLAAFRVNVKITMTVSTAMAFALCIWLQGASMVETIKIAILGFNAPGEIVMMNGGGVVGMVKMIVIVSISLTYAGLFKGMGIIKRIHRLAGRMGHLPPVGFTAIAALATSALSCNQTLAIVLTNEIASGVIPDKRERAIALENTAVVVAPLVPWTVASLIPLGTIGAPTASILFACYLYLLPLLNMRRTAISSGHRQ